MAKKQFNAGKYNSQHKKNIAASTKKIKKLFDDVILQVALIEGNLFYDPKEEFHWNEHPQAEQAVNKLLTELTGGIEGEIRTGNEQAWALSNAKNDAMLDAIGMTTGLPKSKVAEWQQPNLNALQSFMSRTTAGMNLSERVWKLGQQAKAELELAMEIGIGDGKSAAELAKDMKQYLQYPDKLFRRVRDKETGVLRLSKAAAAFHPGRGVYRSSYKNALRMTATENNMAYRTADHTRWQQIPFVIGIEIHTSDNHPVPDICDELKGIYPKEMKFVGFHPWCRCYVTSILASRKEMDRYNDALINDEDTTNWEFEGTVKEMPENWNKWIANNQGRLANAKNLPYFIKDNFVEGGWNANTPEDLQKGLKWMAVPKNTIVNATPKYITAEKFEELAKGMSVTEKEKQILYDSDDLYIDSAWSRTINSELAKGKIGKSVPDDFMDKGSLEQIRTLDAVIAKNTLPEDMWLYRKVSSYWMNREGMDFEVGNVLNEFGFTSTSAVEGANIMRKGKDIMLEIHAPKGTHAYITTNSKESEIILARNTKFKVSSIGERDGNKVVRLEVVNDTKTPQQIAAERHAARTDEEKQRIIKAWNSRKATTKYGEKVLGVVDGIPDIDTSELKKALATGQYEQAAVEAKTIAAMAKQLKKAQYIDDPIQAAKHYSMKEVLEADKAIASKAAHIATKPLEKQKDSLIYEIDYVETHKKYRTWSLAHTAYKKQLASVEEKLEWVEITDSYQQYYGYQTGSKTYKSLLQQANAHILAKDKANYTLKLLDNWKDQLEAKKAKAAATKASKAAALAKNTGTAPAATKPATATTAPAATPPKGDVPTIDVGNKKKQKDHNWKERDDYNRKLEIWQQIQKDTKVRSLHEASQLDKAVNGFSYQWDWEIRQYQMGNTSFTSHHGHTMLEIQERANNLEKYIHLAPKWVGGTTYRGMSLSKSELEDLINDLKNGEGNMLGAASWSTDESVIQGFSKSHLYETSTKYPKEEKDMPVVLITDKHTKATSIHHLSEYPHEEEVLSTKDARWQFKRKYERDGITYIEVKPAN